MVRGFLLDHYAGSLILSPAIEAVERDKRITEMFQDFESEFFFYENYSVNKIAHNKEPGVETEMEIQGKKNTHSRGEEQLMADQKDKNLRFSLEEEQKARIKVVGVGGAGSNAVDNMIEGKLRGVEFIAVNTDMQALDASLAKHKLQIGKDLTKGLGAGGDPIIGRASAEESRQLLGELVVDTDMLFVTVGMGGGTGTGAAPFIAALARERGVLTVGIVSKPFSFEGPKRMKRALEGIEQMKEAVDTLIVIPNDQLLNIIEDDTSFKAAFRKADEVLFQATKGVSDIISTRGYVNLDFADAKAVMSNSGHAIMGVGVKSGKDRSVEAARAAINSPLLGNLTIEGAKSILINITGNENLGMKEVQAAVNEVSNQAGAEADVYFGIVKDDSMGEEISVTVIATGFASKDSGNGGKRSSAEHTVFASTLRQTVKSPGNDALNSGNGGSNGDGSKNGDKVREFRPVDMTNDQPVVDYRPEGLDENSLQFDDTSLPSFLRINKNKYPKLKRRRDGEF